MNALENEKVDISVEAEEVLDQIDKLLARKTPGSLEPAQAAPLHELLLDLTAILQHRPNLADKLRTKLDPVISTLRSFKTDLDNYNGSSNFVDGLLKVDKNATVTTPQSNGAREAVASTGQGAFTGGEAVPTPEVSGDFLEIPTIFKGDLLKYTSKQASERNIQALVRFFNARINSKFDRSYDSHQDLYRAAIAVVEGVMRDIMANWSKYQGEAFVFNQATGKREPTKMLIEVDFKREFRPVAEGILRENRINSSEIPQFVDIIVDDALLFARECKQKDEKRIKV